MLICLIRGVSGDTSAAHQQIPGTVVQTRQLSIGSAPDQQLQVPHEDVDPRHATLRVAPNGRVLLTALGPKGVLVNGRRQTRVHLDPDDTLQLGETTVKVQRGRGEYACIVRVEDPFAIDESQPASAASTRNQSSRCTISFWSWTLTIGVAAIFLLVPIGTFLGPSMRKILRSTPLVPSDALWSSGPLHSAHRFIGNDCTACHLNPFQPVRNSQCEACHAEVQHHVDVRSADVALFDRQRCAQCHFEHKETATLVWRDPRLCTDCHARMSKLKSNALVENSSDFGSNHPEFRLAVLAEDPIVAPGVWRPTWLEASNPATFKEKSHLKFSHAQHLNPKGIESPVGDRVLECGDCHKPNASGREMMPIRMEIQCSGCHSLHFDEHDPSSGVPHGDLPRMFKALREHFSRQYLETGSPARPDGGMRRPGGEARRMSLEEQRRARDWADTQSLKMARELLERRVCVDCHDVTHVVGATGFDQWQVAPVRLTQNWMPRARFDHAAHTPEPCTSCHDTAPRSKQSSDILMPQIGKCRECHGGVGDSSKLESDCVMCHRFHLPNHRFGNTPWRERAPPGSGSVGPSIPAACPLLVKASPRASIHMDKGMHCVDCHFARDNHGNGYIYGEVAQAIEIACVDCHGTADAYPTLRTSGPAAPPQGTDLTLLRNPDGGRRFEWREGKLYQRSLVNPGQEWRVHLVKDSVNPKSPDYNERSARAKLMSKDTHTQDWGLQVPVAQRAHGVKDLECYSCHTSWTTSCGGCHLPTEANWKTPSHRYEGGDSRVVATYNPQVARDDMFSLGRRGPTDGGRIAPVRSSSALVVSQTNINREKT